MIEEPDTVARMQAIQADPDRAEILLAARAEHHQRWALIHTLLQLGRHDHAQQVSNHPDHDAHIAKHREAVKRPDDQWCGCPHTPTELQPLKHSIVGKSYDETADAVRYHYRCNYCGETNATFIPPDPAHDKAAVAGNGLHVRQGNNLVPLDTSGGSIQARAGRSTAQQAMGMVSDQELVQKIGEHPNEG